MKNVMTKAATEVMPGDKIRLGCEWVVVASVRFECAGPDTSAVLLSFDKFEWLKTFIPDAPLRVMSTC